MTDAALSDRPFGGDSRTLVPGWHPDPSNPARERWHDGTTFTEHTHRALKKPSLFGSAFDRSMWAGANAAARRAIRASDAASIVFAFSIVAVLITPITAWAPTALGIALWALIGVAAAQVAFGASALRRATAQGGLGISSAMIAQGSVYLLIGAGYLVGRLAAALA